MKNDLIKLHAEIMFYFPESAEHSIWDILTNPNQENITYLIFQLRQYISIMNISDKTILKRVDNIENKLIDICEMLNT